MTLTRIRLRIIVNSSLPLLLQLSSHESLLDSHLLLTSSPTTTLLSLQTHPQTILRFLQILSLTCLFNMPLLVPTGLLP